MHGQLKTSLSSKNIAITVIVLVLILTVSVTVLNSLKAQFRNKALEHLNVAQNATFHAIKDIWFHDMTVDFKDKLVQPGIVSAVSDILREPANQAALLKSPAQEKLRKHFKNYLIDRQALGIFIINRDGLSLASMRDSNVGTENLIYQQYPAIIEKVFSTKKAQLVPPLISDVPLPNQQGKLSENYPTMFVLLPVLDKQQNVIALMSLRLNPYDTFSRITRLNEFSKSGEVYLFNRQGLMVTQGRYEKKLQQTGILANKDGSILNIALRDPGINLFENKVPVQELSTRPFVYPVQQVLEGVNASNAEGYRDYRGVRVVGSWLWDEDLQLGLIAEIDESEVFAPYYQMRNILIAGIVIIILLLNIFYLVFIRLREQVNRKIAASEEFLTNVVDNAIIGIVTINEQGIITSFNKHAEIIFGYGQDEIKGRNVNLLMPQPYRNEHDSYLNNYIKGGPAKIIGTRREVDAMHKSGNVFPIELAVNDVMMDGQRSFTAIVKDLTFEKEREEQLKRSEVNLSDAQRIARLGSWDLDIVNDRLYWSEQMFELWGLEYSEKPVNYSTFIDGVHPDDRARVQAAIDAAWKNESDYEIEYAVLRADGSVIDAYARGHMRFNMQGKPVRMAGIVMDITEQKKSQHEIEQSERRLREAQQLAHMGSWEMYYEENKLYWSDESFRLWGYDPVNEPISYEKFNERVHPDDRERVQYAIETAMQEESDYKIDYRLLLPNDVKRDIYAQGGVIRDAKGNVVGMSGIVLDITERKQMEKNIIEAREQAEASNRAKSEFLAMMSHEIRTPMNAVIGMSELALNTKLTAKQRSYIEKSYRSAQSLLGIINDVLDFSKIESGHVELESISFNINDMLEKLVHVVGYKAQENGLEFIFDISPDVPVILVGDPTRLSQVLINLGSNAVKFTGQGEITLRIRLLDEDDEKVSLKFEMIDTGIGIEEDKKPKLFNMFEQADSSVTRVYGGTGLGLSICKSLLEMMGGEISVESELGVGSNFSFTLNLERGYGEPGNQLALPEGMENMRVLIVDDNESARMTLNDIILSFGFRTHMAASAWEGIKELKAADQKQRPYGMVLMDWKMPEFDGLQAAREIINDASLSSSPVVLMVTAYSVPELEEVAGNLPLSGVLVKPVSPSALLDTTLQALGSKGFLPSGTVPLFTPTSRDAIEVLRGKRVLVVEDNEMNQDLILELLAEAEILTELAHNGQQAIDCLDKQMFDAVLMDVHMPVMDGYSATRAIRSDKRFTELPIIAMTANALAGDRKRCLDAGMTDYISKPVNIQKLLVTLVKTITGEEIAAGSVAPLTNEKDIIVLEGKFPTISNIDIRAGLHVSNNNTRLYQRLLKKFINNESFPETFTEAINHGDITTAERMAHTLKGSAGNIGAEQLQLLAMKLQNLCAEKASTAKIMSALHILQDELAIITESLKEFCREETDESGKPMHLSDEELNRLINKLMVLLTENDTEAAESFVTLKSALSDRGIDDEEIKPLIKAIDEYDFDMAVKELDKIQKLTGIGLKKVQVK